MAAGAASRRARAPDSHCCRRTTHRLDKQEKRRMLKKIRVGPTISDVDFRKVNLCEFKRGLGHELSNARCKIIRMTHLY